MSSINIDSSVTISHGFPVSRTFLTDSSYHILCSDELISFECRRIKEIHSKYIRQKKCAIDRHVHAYMIFSENRGKHILFLYLYGSDRI